MLHLTLMAAMAPDLVALARSCLPPHADLYIAPNIPPSVHAAARAAHRLAPDEPILVLYNATVFGTSALGLSLTPRSLLWRNFGEDPGCVPFASIDADFLTPSCDTLVLAHHRIELPSVLAWAVAALLREVAPAPAAAGGPYREPPRADGEDDGGLAPMSPREIAAAAFRVLAGARGVTFGPYLGDEAMEHARGRYALPEGESVAVEYADILMPLDGFLLTEGHVYARLDGDVRGRRYPTIEPHTIKVFEGTVRVLGGVVPYPSSAASPDQFADLLRRIVRRAGGEDLT